MLETTSIKAATAKTLEINRKIVSGDMRIDGLKIKNLKNLTKSKKATKAKISVFEKTNSSRIDLLTPDTNLTFI